MIINITSNFVIIWLLCIFQNQLFTLVLQNRFCLQKGSLKASLVIYFGSESPLSNDISRKKSDN